MRPFRKFKILIIKLFLIIFFVRLTKTSTKYPIVHNKSNLDGQNLLDKEQDITGDHVCSEHEFLTLFSQQSFIKPLIQPDVSKIKRLSFGKNITLDEIDNICSAYEARFDGKSEGAANKMLRVYGLAIKRSINIFRSASSIDESNVALKRAENWNEKALRIITAWEKSGKLTNLDSKKVTTHFRYNIDIPYNAYMANHKDLDEVAKRNILMRIIKFIFSPSLRKKFIDRNTLAEEVLNKITKLKRKKHKYLDVVASNYFNKIRKKVEKYQSEITTSFANAGLTGMVISAIIFLIGIVGSTIYLSTDSVRNAKNINCGTNLDEEKEVDISKHINKSSRISQILQHVTLSEKHGDLLFIFAKEEFKKNKKLCGWIQSIRVCKKENQLVYNFKQKKYSAREIKDIYTEIRKYEYIIIGMLKEVNKQIIGFKSQYTILWKALNSNPQNRKVLQEPKKYLEIKDTNVYISISELRNIVNSCTVIKKFQNYSVIDDPINDATPVFKRKLLDILNEEKLSSNNGIPISQIDETKYFVFDLTTKNTEQVTATQFLHNIYNQIRKLAYNLSWEKIDKEEDEKKRKLQAQEKKNLEEQNLAQQNTMMKNAKRIKKMLNKNCQKGYGEITYLIKSGSYVFRFEQTCSKEKIQYCEEGKEIKERICEKFKQLDNDSFWELKSKSPFFKITIPCNILDETFWKTLDHYCVNLIIATKTKKEKQEHDNKESRNNNRFFPHKKKKPKKKKKYNKKNKWQDQNKKDDDQKKTKCKFIPKKPKVFQNHDSKVVKERSAGPNNQSGSNDTIFFGTQNLMRDYIKDIKSGKYIILTKKDGLKIDKALYYIKLAGELKWSGNKILDGYKVMFFTAAITDALQNCSLKSHVYEVFPQSKGIRNGLWHYLSLLDQDKLKTHFQKILNLKGSLEKIRRSSNKLVDQVLLGCTRISMSPSSIRKKDYGLQIQHIKNNIERAYHKIYATCYSKQTNSFNNDPLSKIVKSLWGELSNKLTLISSIFKNEITLSVVDLKKAFKDNVNTTVTDFFENCQKHQSKNETFQAHQAFYPHQEIINELCLAIDTRSDVGLMFTKHSKQSAFILNKLYTELTDVIALQQEQSSDLIQAAILSIVGRMGAILNHSEYASIKNEFFRKEPGLIRLLMAVANNVRHVVKPVDIKSSGISKPLFVNPDVFFNNENYNNIIKMAKIILNSAYIKDLTVHKFNEMSDTAIHSISY